MMKMTANLIHFITSSSLLNLLLYFLLQMPECDAKKMMNDPAYNCSPSSCGVVRNISFPFRLKDDPKRCGKPDYELACENNVTTVYINSEIFHVKAINYDNRTIRLGHVSINTNMTCSFPEYSAYAYNFSHGYPYGIQIYNSSSLEYFDSALPINFISCPYALKNSSLLTETRDCMPKGGRHTYIKVGRMIASDVKEDMCSVDNIVLTSWKFKDSNNVSLLEIHESLLYGFQLHWLLFYCKDCSYGLECPRNEGDLATCRSYGLLYTLHVVWGNIKSSSEGPGVISGPFPAILLFVLLILVVLFAGVSLPAMIIIAFICASTFFLVEKNASYFNTYWHVSHLRLIIGIFLSLRLLIVFPCMMWILIEKFQRRHLSRFDAIEDFLQSDNKLMPIRYSYSDIKRMTRGFGEKLGQGGYGSVYKGKLRSGHYVAVKVLGKHGGNGQDFMNEIATIGRIHHFNVVKLVGFCVEGTKRALVFDFMSNGSLEKYIFNRENMKSLTWDKKYEIAVGVARGIEYLHRGCDIQILHFDIKPHNILLDDNFIPKITDFGLAKVCSTDKKTVTLTAVRGTIGYVAPELINRGIGGVSYKADVYSFGMLLMEMVGLNRNMLGNVGTSSKYFPCWIYDCFEQGKDIEIGKIDEDNDDDDDNNDATRLIAQKMTIVALWCIQMSPDARPSMNKVLEMLEANVECLQIPNRSSQSSQVALNMDQSWTTTYSTDSISLLTHDVVHSVEIAL